VNLGASFKHFDFSAFFQGVGKVSINTLVIEKAPRQMMVISEQSIKTAGR
jgi:hypothetical protein